MPYSSKPLIIYAVAGLAAWLQSCAPTRQILTEPTGIVIEVKGNTYMVASKIISKAPPGSQLIQWIYKKDHGYKKGDTWPNCENIPHP